MGPIVGHVSKVLTLTEANQLMQSLGFIIPGDEAGIIREGAILDVYHSAVVNLYLSLKAANQQIKDLVALERARELLDLARDLSYGYIFRSEDGTYIRFLPHASWNRKLCGRTVSLSDPDALAFVVEGVLAGETFPEVTR